MKKVFFVFVFLSHLALNTLAQNLVVDPSMESHTYILDTFSTSCDSVYLHSTKWRQACTSPTVSDYLHQNINCTPSATNSLCCIPFNSAGFQWPKNGLAYYFMVLFEYFVNADSVRQMASLRGSLNTTLIQGRTYCFSMYVSAAENFNLFTDQIGVYFSKTDFSASLPTIDSVPQLVIKKQHPIMDTSSWMLLNGTFVANGGEKFITIGLFESQKPYPVYSLYPDSVSGYIFHPEYNYHELVKNWNGIFIDMVSLYDCTGFYYEAEAGDNRSQCKGEETTLGWDENTARTFKWSVVKGDSASLDNDSIPRPTVSPQKTTVYALYVVDEYVQEHFDTVTVEVIDCENPVFVPNIFSPNNDGQNDVLHVRSSYVQELTAFRIYNRWGEEVFSCRTSTPLSVASNECGWDGTYRGEPAPQAVYTYYVEAVLLNGEPVVKRGNVTLVR